MVAVPSGVLVFGWTATLWLGRPVWRTPLLFALGFVAIFVLGGLTGVMLAVVPIALRAHGCGGCHVIPDLLETRGTAGPSLRGLANRAYITGRLANQPLNVAAWIRSPRTIDPGTLMPDLGVSESEARDIAAYLYSVDADSRATGPPWPPTPESPATKR